MKIKLNGEQIEIDVKTMAELCQNLGYDQETKIATAVNGEFVPAAIRANYQLAENDDVEIVAPRQGG